MYHMLLLLLTASPAVIGYTLLMKQQDREGGFCVTDDYHGAVAFIPDISRRPKIPSHFNNSQQPWTSEWQFENFDERINNYYWSADPMWHGLNQISTYASDGLSQLVNLNKSENIYEQHMFLSVLAKSLEIYLEFDVSYWNYNPYYVERKYYIISMDFFDEANKRKWLRLKSCTSQDVCISHNDTVVDFLEDGRSWVHLDLTILISAVQGIQINVKKRGQDFYHALQDKTNTLYSFNQLISANFKSNKGAAFIKLHQGKIMSPLHYRDIFAIIKGTIVLHEGRNICLDITWKYNLPSELHLEINTQTHSYISHSYKSPSFEFDMKTRLIEYLPQSGNYTISLKFKSYGGVSDVRFCSNKKDAIQIIHSDDYLKGCQLLANADQNDIVIESKCSKYYSSTPSAFPFVLLAICSKIALEHHLDGFCDNYKVCDHLQCICIHKEASTISPSTANAVPQLTTLIPESAHQNCTQDLSKNSSCIGTTSNEALCPWSQQFLTLCRVVLSFLCVVIVILTVMAVQSYRSLKELEAAQDCTPQNNFELQPIPDSSTNTIYPNPH